MSDIAPHYDEVDRKSPFPPMKDRTPMGRSKALDDGLYGVWPDFAANPFMWDKRMRGIMASTLRHNGIAMQSTVNRLIKEALDTAKDTGVLGDKRKTLRIFGHVCRTYKAEKRHSMQHTKDEIQKAVIKTLEIAGKGYYETGFEPNIDGAMAAQEEFRKREAERLARLEADNAASRAEFEAITAERDIQEGNVQDELTKADQTATAKHFSQEQGFYKELAKHFQKRKGSAVIPDYVEACHEWFEVKSLTELAITETAFYAMLDNELSLRFDTQKPAETKNAQKATQDDETKPSATTPAVDTAPNVQGSDASVEPANVIAFRQSLPRTITGISVLDIGKELNKHLPPEAYGAIKFGQMSGKTDIDGDAVRDRYDKVFGSGMWRIAPHPTAGRVEYHTEVRQGIKGEQTWHLFTLVAHTFQYALIMPDGAIQWTDGMTTTDMHDNTDQQYAYRGAMTSLMKQFYKLMGGLNHVIYGEYNHENAARDLAAQRRKAS